MRMFLTGRGAAGVDVLRWPVVGRLLRWRHARTSLQLGLLAAAAVVVLHGLFGPDIAPGNLATVLTWVHYRGLLVVALLAAGNFFCAGCPFVLVRDWGRRLHAPARLWPKRLRGKWMALVLFVARAVRLRALRSVGAAARHGVSRARLLRRRAGDRLGLQGRDVLQASLPNRPVQLRGLDDVAARAADTRAGDVSGVPDIGLHLRTPRRSQPPQVILQRGCELGLYLPAKVGNIDCTFCLDCVQACPHDNIATDRPRARPRARRCAPAIGDRPARQPS